MGQLGILEGYGYLMSMSIRRVTNKLQQYEAKTREKQKLQNIYMLKLESGLTWNVGIGTWNWKYVKI